MPSKVQRYETLLQLSPFAGYDNGNKKTNIYKKITIHLLLLSMCPVPHDLDHRALIITINMNRIEINEPNKISVSLLLKYTMLLSWLTYEVRCVITWDMIIILVGIIILIISLIIIIILIFIMIFCIFYHCELRIRKVSF